jgi:hypothetical protein
MVVISSQEEEEERKAKNRDKQRDPKLPTQRGINLNDNQVTGLKMYICRFLDSFKEGPKSDSLSLTKKIDGVIFIKEV